MTPIDLTQFEGHTPRPWTIGASYPRIDWYQIVTPRVTFDNTSSDTVIANANLFAHAPDMKDEIIELRAERDAIKASLAIAEDEYKANTDILSALTLALGCEHYGELVAEVGRRKADAEIAFIEDSKLKSHAAEMSATLEGFVAYGEKVKKEIKSTSDLYICHIPRANSALEAWRETQGEVKPGTVTGEAKVQSAPAGMASAKDVVLCGVDTSTTGIDPAKVRKLLGEVRKDMTAKDEGWKVCAAYYATKLIALISEAGEAEPVVPLSVVDSIVAAIDEYMPSPENAKRNYVNEGRRLASQHCRQFIVEALHAHRPKPKADEPKCKRCGDTKNTTWLNRGTNEREVIPCPDCAKGDDPDAKR